MSDGEIVRCAIHPGIGIARVGNSHESFVGPEVPGVASTPSGGYKDNQGRIKRQMARFRIYGYNAAGQVVRELTADEADITWSVHLANKKAAWYQFKLALDTPEAKSPNLPASLRSHRRNPDITDRARLTIDPGSRSIKGKNASGQHFDSGKFMGKAVSLGELRTDRSGNLLVLGGRGHSGTPLANNPAKTFGNNYGWYDDISDGPVSARVRIGGRNVPVTQAWVIVAPPAYAPGIQAIVTLYDIAYQAHLDAHPPRTPGRVSFTRHIYPILERFDGLQWVNQGFYEGYGWKGDVPLLDSSYLAKLASNSTSHASDRQFIFDRFRDPAYQTIRENAWPRVYGDSFDQPPRYPQEYLAVTREQYRRLREWARGNFEADWTGPPTPPDSFEAIPLRRRPSALDEAALLACSGGPFHPGVEATWPLRVPTMYAGLCRLRVRTPSDPPEPNYGDVLTPAEALGANGPFHRSGPGDVTRWMAIPWQTDTSSCGSAYPNTFTPEGTPLPDLPTFWPAGVPNKILTEQAYRRIMDGSLSADERRRAFGTRAAWSRHLPPDYQDRINAFVTEWYKMGLIEPRPGPGHGLGLPPEMRVEAESGFPETTTAMERALAVGGGAVEDLPSQPLVENWRELQ